MRHAMMTTLMAMMAMGCSDDPTFDELIRDWQISFGGENHLYGNFRDAKDMKPLDCTLAGQPVTCFDLRDGCGVGHHPSVCFNESAELVGCIDGAMRHPRGPIYVNEESTPDGPRAVVALEGRINPHQLDRWMRCEDQR